MKRAFVTMAALSLMAVSACDGSSDAASSEGSAQADVARMERAAPPEGAPNAPAVLVSAEPAAPGAPDFAALYPDAVVEAPATIADGEAGPGGLITFTTDADPETVIAFYRERAEASGLASVMAMNQGDAQAYGAAAPEGANLQVVAAPTEAGPTSVQLSWSAGT